MDTIFNLFSQAVEQVTIKRATSGAIDSSLSIVAVVDAIVKRRSGKSSDQNNADIYNNSTTIHFRSADDECIELGYYVEIDGVLREIISKRYGKDFDTGDIEFILVAVGDEIKDSPDSPSWSSPSV